MTSRSTYTRRTGLNISPWRSHSSPQTADCLQELRWLYDRRDLPEARRDLAAWLAKWSGKYSKPTCWIEENIDETLSFIG